ncbi:hypothetical protein SLS58_007978 [Diplodia intermedia]|uniref:Major facilitator superfamily (MFS) profile domain-containing protein n=1 Tax=Diplodia intermedia TaxID=856260 RepID=A0ABR3TIM7_9PEZI
MKEEPRDAVATDDAVDDAAIEEKEPQEGGLHAWLTVVGSALVYFASFGFMNSFGYFQDFYQANYLANYSSSTIAFIGTLQISLMYVVGPVAGALFDSYGLKGVLFGLTVAFGVQPALAAAGQHFKQRRALAMGVVAGGSSIGGVCLPIMFSRIVPKIGFGWSVRVAALLFLCCYLAAMCISRTKRAPKKAPAAAQTAVSNGSLLDFNGFKDPRYLALAIGSFVASLGLYVPYYYIESYTVLAHPSASIHIYLLPLINAASFFGRVIGGFLADRVGRLNLLYPMTLLSGVFCLAIWLPAGSNSVAAVVAFVCLYGFSSGIFISVTPAVVAQLSPDDAIGARIGAFFTLAAVATLGLTLTVGGAFLLFARVLCERDLRTKW